MCSIVKRADHAGAARTSTSDPVFRALFPCIRMYAFFPQQQAKLIAIHLNRRASLLETPTLRSKKQQRRPFMRQTIIPIITVENER